MKVSGEDASPSRRRQDATDPDPPLDWSSRAHVYPDEEGKPLIRISLEYSHETFASIKCNGARRHLLCIHNHPVYSGLWRVKKIHPGGKVITCYMHRDIHMPDWLLPGGGGGNAGAYGGNETPGVPSFKSPGRLPPIADRSPGDGFTEEGEGEGGGADDATTPGAAGGTEQAFTNHPMDMPFWDVELHPDKNAGVPQNLSMTHRIPLADSGRHARRRKTTVCFAPPLLFHTRMDVHNIWKIDSMQQMFSADVTIETRLRSVVVGEPDMAAAQGAIDELFTLYEVDHKALEVRDADFTDYVYWHDLAVSGTQGRWDYVYRIRCKAFFNSRMQLQSFPFDQQHLAMRVRLNMPRRFGVLVLDTERPSHFHVHSFHLASMWSVVHDKMILADFQADVADGYLEEAADVTSLCTFKVVVSRRADYYLYNAFVPMGGLALAGVVSFCVGEAAAAMYTGERLVIVLLLASMTLFVKHATTYSIPHVSDTTLLDQWTYIIMCLYALAVVVHFVASRPYYQDSLPDTTAACLYFGFCCVSMGVWYGMAHVHLMEQARENEKVGDAERSRRVAEEEKKSHIDNLRVGIRVKHTKYMSPLK